MLISEPSAVKALSWKTPTADAACTTRVSKYRCNRCGPMPTTSGAGNNDAPPTPVNEEKSAVATTDPSANAPNEPIFPPSRLTM